MDRQNGGPPPYDDKNEGAGKWKTILTCLVEPDVKEEPKWMEWSPMDQLWWERYSSYFFLYKPKSEVFDGDSVLPIGRLIESLGKALVHFFPLAGRLMKSKKDVHVRLYCNNEGAVFMHKRYDGILSELIDEDQFQSNKLISGLSDLQPNAETYDPSGLPALIIQVTEFRCGTRALSASWNHGVADGSSGLHFLSSWARISRGEPLSLMPVHDRSLLSPRKPSPVLDLEGGRARFLNNEPQKDSIEITVPNDGMRLKTLKFSRKKMDELKAEARGDASQSVDGHGRALSAADCVTAHLWRLITKIRNHEPHELTRFVSLVNGRSRIKGFPAGYFGNCLVGATSVMTARELLSKPLNHAATVIHDAIQSVDEDVFRGWVDWFSANEFNMRSFGDEVFMPGDPRFNLHSVSANWQNRFPFFDLDFGSGIPSNAIRNGFSSSAYDCGMFFALPTSTTATLGDLKISVYGENNVLDKLGDQL